MWLACPPAERTPPTIKRFLQECCTDRTTVDDLARFIVEEGFLEAVAREPSHWLKKRHEVMAAIYANAMDSSRKDQREWCEYYFERLEQMQKDIMPMRGRMKVGSEAPEIAIDDDDEVVPLSSPPGASE